MILRPELKQLIAQAQAEIEQDEAHHLKPRRQLDVYREIGPTTLPYTELELPQHIERLQKGELNLTPADKVRVWLDILAAEHVLTVWYQVKQLQFPPEEEFCEEHNMPQDHVIFMLGVAKKLTENNAPEFVKSSGTLLNSYFHYALANETFGTIAAQWVAEAAYEALSAAFMGINPPFRGKDQIWNATTDDNRGSGSSAFWAMSAYAAVDKIKQQPENRGKYRPRAEYIDPQKRLEFWLWWLNVAIPLAHAMV